jgi:hypothetical protein
MFCPYPLLSSLLTVSPFLVSGWVLTTGSHGPVLWQVESRSAACGSPITEAAQQGLGGKSKHPTVRTSLAKRLSGYSHEPHPAAHPSCWGGGGVTDLNEVCRLDDDDDDEYYSMSGARGDS